MLWNLPLVVPQGPEECDDVVDTTLDKVKSTLYECQH